jgi:hypothetical protein
MAISAQTITSTKSATAPISFRNRTGMAANIFQCCEGRAQHYMVRAPATRT